MELISIRGAITTENTVEDILQDTKVLLGEIERQNNIDKNNVVSIIFSSTKDLNKVYPARAARDMGYTDIGLMCFQEMDVENSLEKCIRVMFLLNKDMDFKKHIYMKGAKILRPDLEN